ncbi:MAG TPA: adenylosuccinate synthase [Candidatus Saccharicenans sp.]|jgi:adenylosuccinate synthase|nr:adenylosuccinate synthase [Candidatus Saccharicenans sp.]HRD03026.1 adenylosuccinate synthase [Candidatus Saccharicenans sp.]
MNNLLVIGTQWGDEGKGKVVDFLAPAFDIIARYQGGHNAGHTVYLEGKKIVLHLIPSGILHPDKIGVIGNGLVIDPGSFFKELDDLKSIGVEVNEKRLAVSRSAHVIMPYHPRLEKISEAQRGKKMIGTTCRGIGPCYEDKAARWGIRIGDLLEPEILREKIEENLAVKNKIFEAFGQPTLEAGPIYEQYRKFGEGLAPFVKDVSAFLYQQVKAGKSILFEGAQGVLLDLDHGTYPYVTSSSSTAGGVATGLGLSPKQITGILGITKAYATRVGSGPFPTELKDETGALLARKGDEFGATTGRPRRCGWFDAVAARYSCRINGVDLLALTKPDVLEGLSEIKACYAYEYKGSKLKDFLADPHVLDKVQPVYRTFPVWEDSIQHLSNEDKLPAGFNDYVKWLEDELEIPVGIISTGVAREDIIYIKEKCSRLLGAQAEKLFGKH